jgi:DNA recombination protein RmuC
MEQFGLAIILFASFWVGAVAGWMAMKLRERSAYERGKADAISELASLKERLEARDAQILELRQKVEAGATETVRLATELKAESDRRATAEARGSLIPKYETEIEARGKRIMDMTQDLAKLQSALAQATARSEESKKHTDEKISSLSDLQEQLGAAFRAISAEALQSNNQAFLDLAASAMSRFQEAAKGDMDLRQQAIGEIVKPLKEQLEKVDTRIIEFEKERSGVIGAITQQVDSLVKAQQSLQAETKNLVHALRTPAARGRWGEVQLRRVVEMAGMVEYCDFEEQPHVETADGSLRPDLVVQLPNQRKIVIDSKVSLSAYLESLDATDENARVEKLKQHAEQVRAHLVRLSAKQYWDQFSQSPEFVVAFLPGETFFSAALEQDPSLVEFGVERRVILATPTTLIALLKAIAYGWKQEKLSANAREIRDLGKTLYDRMRTVAEHFTELRKNLDRTNQSFNKAVGTLEARVMPSARRFKELGAGSGDEIPVVLELENSPRSLQVLSEEIGVSAVEEEPVASA